MPIKAVFFDFDGVIKDSTEVKTDAFAALYQDYGQEVVAKVVNHHRNHGGVSRFEKFKLYHEEFLGIILTQAEILALADQFSSLVLQKVIESDYIDGALETIQSLKNSGFILNIVTGTPQTEIEFILNQLEISSFFNEICGSPTHKIVWCERLLEKQSLDEQEVLFVGDASTDYEAAMHHGFHFALREHEENKEYFSQIECYKKSDLKSLYADILNGNI
jgi:HAD superfamily hydrolase (TIGR01549 family)